MKDDTDKRSELVRFEDAITQAIEAAPALTVSEVVGCLELSLHVYKCRYYPPPHLVKGPAE